MSIKTNTKRFYFSSLSTIGVRKIFRRNSKNMAVAMNNTSMTTFAQRLCLEDINPKFVQNIKIAALCVLMAFGAVGNTVIVYIFYKIKNLRSTTNNFILNIAIGNLLLPTLGIPVDILAVTHSSKWLIGGNFGLAMCKLTILFRDVSFAVSIESMVLIAFDRFYAVVFAMKKKLITKKISVYAILCSWIVAIGLNSPTFYTAKLKQENGENLCYSSWEPAFNNSITQPKYYATMMVILYVLPLGLIIFFYSAIIIDLKRNRKSTGRNLPDKEKQKRKIENRKIMQMLVTIVVLFVLCFTPLHIYASIHFFSKPNTPFSCSLEILKGFAFFMMDVDCAINPLIYFAFLKHYRQSFRVVFLPWCKRWCVSRKRSYKGVLRVF